MQRGGAQRCAVVSCCARCAAPGPRVAPDNGRTLTARRLPQWPGASVLQLFVVTAIVIVVAVRVAKAPGSFVVGVARKNVASGGLRDQPISVLLAEEPRTHISQGRIPHDTVVPLLTAVTLLDGQARIATRRPVSSGHRERNVAGGQVASLPCSGPLAAGFQLV